MGVPWLVAIIWLTAFTCLRIGLLITLDAGQVGIDLWPYVLTKGLLFDLAGRRHQAMDCSARPVGLAITSWCLLVRSRCTGFICDEATHRQIVVFVPPLRMAQFLMPG